MKKFYGCIPDHGDHRDHLLALSAMPLPPAVDLRSQMPPIYDQGQLGSCTANAIGAAFQYEHIRQGLEDFIPSRLFIYFNERVIENTVRSDAGAMIRDGIKTIARQGVCPETMWPYIIERFDVRPPTSVYQVARNHISINYKRVPRDQGAILEALAHGCPVILGFSVYESFESLQVEKTGIVPMPTLDEAYLGGHAVLCVGYDLAAQHFIIRNSWGNGWGDAGYCYFPFGYFVKTSANDFWIVQKVG